MTAPDTFVSETDHEAAEAQLEGDRCRRLWCAVMLTAIEDGERKWFSSEDGATVASFAGLDHAALLGKLDGIMAKRDPMKLSAEQKQQRDRDRARAWARRKKALAIAAE